MAKAGKVFMTTQINNSPTISVPAGAAIADVRGVMVKYDATGAIVPASVAGEAVIGMGIITNGENIPKGADVDIQIKDIGLVEAGAAIAAGDEIATNAAGKAVKATDGQFVLGFAKEAAAAGDLFFVAIAKYYKPEAASASSGT